MAIGPFQELHLEDAIIPENRRKLLRDRTNFEKLLQEQNCKYSCLLFALITVVACETIKEYLRQKRRPAIQEKIEERRKKRMERYKKTIDLTMEGDCKTEQIYKVLLEFPYKKIDHGGHRPPYHGTREYIIPPTTILIFKRALVSPKQNSDRSSPFC